MSTYHILKNGMPMEVSEASLRKMQESQENITLDDQWYLNHGGIRFDDFKKSHQVNVCSDKNKSYEDD